jgi:putative transposase
VAVIDWYSRYIVSWALDDTLAMPFVMVTVDQALERAMPVIWNSDQGSQFTSSQERDRLQAVGVQISMDGTGRALDNVIIERFWRNLTYDDVYLKGYTTPRAARHGIADYMHRYNDIRLHQALGYQTPGSVYRGDMPRADGKNGAWG